MLIKIRVISERAWLVFDHINICYSRNADGWVIRERKNIMAADLYPVFFLHGFLMPARMQIAHTTQEKPFYYSVDVAKCKICVSGFVMVCPTNQFLVDPFDQLTVCTVEIQDQILKFLFAALHLGIGWCDLKNTINLLIVPPNKVKSLRDMHDTGLFWIGTQPARIQKLIDNIKNLFRLQLGSRRHDHVIREARHAATQILILMAVWIQFIIYVRL